MEEITSLVPICSMYAMFASIRPCSLIVWEKYVGKSIPCRTMDPYAVCEPQKTNDKCQPSGQME